MIYKVAFGACWIHDPCLTSYDDNGFICFVPVGAVHDWYVGTWASLCTRIDSVKCFTWVHAFILILFFTDRAYSKNSNNTQNTDSRAWAFAHHHVVLQREGLPKIAFIPEKEYNYLFIHNFWHIPFLCRMTFLQNKKARAWQLPVSEHF